MSQMTKKQSLNNHSHKSSTPVVIIFAVYLLLAAINVPAYGLSMTPTWGLATDAWPTTDFKLQTTYLPPSSGDTAYVNEGNGGPDGSVQQFGQTFSPTSDFTMTGIAVTISGAAMDITLALYDVGADTSEPLVPATVDLTGLTKLWEETVSFPGAGAETVAMFTFSGSDLIELQAGEKYIFTITESVTVQNTFLWYRSGATAYTGGQMYRGTATLDNLTQVASWAVRVAGLAAYGITPPGQATNPTPADGATGVAITQTLSWTADINATSHDVYFGTDFNDVDDADINDANVFMGNQSETTFDPGTLTEGTAYYWRIDEIDANGTTTGDVWSFTAEQPYDLNILKMTVKAGRTQGADANDIANIKDSFTASGTFEDVPADLNTVSQLDLTLVSLDGDDTLVYSETISFSDYYDPNKNQFKYLHKITADEPNGAITSLMLNFYRDPMTFSVKTKNIDLTGLACPLQLNIWLDDTAYSGDADDTIVNGPRKTIPTRLMRMFNDTLIVTKAKATPLGLSIKGEIAVEDINNTDLDEPNLVVADVNIIWSDQTFTLLAGSLEAYKTGHRYKCSKVDPLGGNDGLVTAKFDLDKCTFNLSIKEANNLDTGTDADVEFGINFGDANETDFDEVKDVNLPSGRSI